MAEDYKVEFNSDGEPLLVEDRHTVYVLYGNMSEEEVAEKLRQLARENGFGEKLITRYIINTRSDRGNFGHIWLEDTRLRDLILREWREKQAGEDRQAIDDVLANPSIEYRILGEGSPRKQEIPFPEEMFSAYSIGISDLDNKLGNSVSFNRLFLGKRPSWLKDEEILQIAQNFATQTTDTIIDKHGKPRTHKYPYILHLNRSNNSLLLFHPDTYDALFAQLFLMKYPFKNPQNPQDVYPLFCKHCIL